MKTLENQIKQSSRQLKQLEKNLEKEVTLYMSDSGAHVDIFNLSKITNDSKRYFFNENFSMRDAAQMAVDTYNERKN